MTTRSGKSYGLVDRTPEYEKNDTFDARGRLYSANGHFYDEYEKSYYTPYVELTAEQKKCELDQRRLNSGLVRPRIMDLDHESPF